MKRYGKWGKNKSPGNDGLSTAFYTTFWGEIGGAFIKSTNHALKTAWLSGSQRNGIITLIPKPDKDPWSKTTVL